MDIIQLYIDYNLDYKTEGHKHCREGWVNIECPFCSSLPGANPGYHLGFELEKGYFYCWRCGWKPKDKVISTLLGVSITESQSILRQYNLHISTHKREPIPVKIKPFKFPSHTEPLQKSHRTYLTKRGFDPDELIKNWGIMGTGPISKLDKIDFKHRIIVPIHWNEEVVSFQARDLTNKSELKYITCSKDREKVFHKSIVYGNQKFWVNRKGIIVEGVTDVWRLGVNSLATFGIQYTPAQVRVIAKNFDRAFICFDPEGTAQQKAEILKSELEFRNVECVWIRDLKTDPGDMSPDEAEYLTKQLIK